MADLLGHSRGSIFDTRRLVGSKCKEFSPHDGYGLTFKKQKVGGNEVLEGLCPSGVTSSLTVGSIEFDPSLLDQLIMKLKQQQEDRARRIGEQKCMLAAKKLCLVLYLDHTLLNSVMHEYLKPENQEILTRKEEKDREKPRRHLFRLPHVGLWTKLRPGIWNFLEKASKLYQLHICTMGDTTYAREMAKLLDPTGVLFDGRVLSKRNNVKVPKCKDFEGILGTEFTAIIMDDKADVWPENKLNLIHVADYTYFPTTRGKSEHQSPSLLELDSDEELEDGTLMSSLVVLERIHDKFFSNSFLPDVVDVREILATEQLKVLDGCHILFSGIFPMNEPKPHQHPLWQIAKQFGALCTTQMNSQVTHVVTHFPTTEKAKWAFSTGKFVVSPRWIQASSFSYRRANEGDFALIQT